MRVTMVSISLSLRLRASIRGSGAPTGQKQVQNPRRLTALGASSVPQKTRYTGCFGQEWSNDL